MLVIICIKYGKNPSRTVDATERTRFSRPRPNDLEGIGQGQRSLYATHLLLLMILCARYGKNQLRTEDFFFKVKAEKFQKFKFSDFEKNVTRDTPSIDSNHLCHIRKESIQNYRCYKADTIFSVKAKWPWRYRSRSKVITCDTPSHPIDHLYQIWKESIKNCRCYRADTKKLTDRQTDRRTDGQTDRQTDRLNPIYPPNFVAGGTKTK